MSARDEVGDAPGDGAGLAGARAGQHADRATRGEHGFALFLIEVVDNAQRIDLYRHAVHLDSTR